MNAQIIDRSQVYEQQSRLARFAPITLRLVLGIIFAVHGFRKLIMIAGAVQSFRHLGIPLPGVAAPAIALLEFIGGLAFLLGIGTRIFGVLIAIEMIVAIFIVKLRAGFVGGYEFELLLVAGLLSLVLSGPGAIAIMRKKNSIFA